MRQTDLTPLDNVSDQCMLQLHAAVGALLIRMLKRYPDAHREVVGGMVAAIVHELFAITAAANVTLGGQSGLDMVKTMLGILDDAVYSRTLHLRHVADEIWTEWVNG